jgi:endonuclease/exonuclease/phosphatase (EEP) superfamily protein YafD
MAVTWQRLDGASQKRRFRTLLVICFCVLVVQTAAAQQLKVATFNLYWQHDDNALSQFAGLIARSDVAMLQEVRDPTVVAELASRSGLASFDSVISAGIAILSRFPFTPGVGGVYCESGFGRFLVKHSIVNGIEHRFISTHYPQNEDYRPVYEWGKRVELSECIMNFINRDPVPVTIMGGDFNSRSWLKAIRVIAWGGMWEACTNSPQPPYKCDEQEWPRHRPVDYIFFKGPYRVQSHESIPGEPSDHDMLLSTLGYDATTPAAPIDVFHEDQSYFCHLRCQASHGTCLERAGGTREERTLCDEAWRACFRACPSASPTRPAFPVMP